MDMKNRVIFAEPAEIEMSYKKLTSADMAKKYFELFCVPERFAMGDDGVEAVPFSPEEEVE